MDSPAENLRDFYAATAKLGDMSFVGYELKIQTFTYRPKCWRWSPEQDR